MERLVLASGGSHVCFVSLAPVATAPARSSTMHWFSLQSVVLALCAASSALGFAQPQLEAQPAIKVPIWETSLTRPGDPRYVALDYICLFVANEGDVNRPTEQRPVHLGLDVIAANNPVAMGHGGGLYALLPDGRVKKLFPLPVHEAIPSLIDTPVGQTWRGAVVEPNISEDGTRVHFGWFHDQTWKRYGGGWLNQELSYKGCDLYTIDLTALIADHDTDVSTLRIRRLTFKSYDGFHKGNVRQTLASRTEYAVHPANAAHAALDWGTVNMHMVEMRTEHGLKAVFVSDRARLGNSNAPVDTPNHNINLYIADIRQDGSLGPAHQFQYYTTTSALSPIPLRDGIAFSYQSSTENYRRWDLQAVTSSGVWSPLLGHGAASELFHFGTLVTRIAPSGGFNDQFIGVRYYNLSNAGMGQFHLMDLDQAGTNYFAPYSGALVPRQPTRMLTLRVISTDLPSDPVMVGNEHRYVGKLTTPKAGRLGGEYVAAYTPTSANRWIPDDRGRFGVFDAHIVYRPDLQPFEPFRDFDPAARTGLARVVDDTSEHYNLIWPTPVLSWQERHGEAQQRYSPSVIDPNSTIAPGLPYAQVGTSAIWNTDARPYDCWLGALHQPYMQVGLPNDVEVALDQNHDPLRYVQDQGDLCQYLLPSTVLGIQINITSNRTDPRSVGTPAFETDSTLLTFDRGQKEATKILGVFAPGEENPNDQSFMAVIPADVPFDFHLLDARYGMKLVDVRSWHSLQPRETRNNCGGCHQHEAGMGIPFAGTDASLQPPLDMTALTKFIAYDQDCRPTLQTSPTPTMQVPEWRADIWPEFHQHCGTCHDALTSTDQAALMALGYTDEFTAFDQLRRRRYASSVLGALGSPAFWAAYGERTDGRDNSLPAYQPNYAAGQWGFHFSALHAVNPGLCAVQNPGWADWVHRFGVWIDNHMPRDTGLSTSGFHTDRFHPTVDFAYTGVPGQIRIGYWDDEGLVNLEIAVNGQVTQSHPNLRNGSRFVTDAGLLPTDVIKVTVTDPTGNRQIKEKTILDLMNE
jgi:hypothetical protein